MDQATHNKIVSFIWGIADDVLRDLFNRGKYPDVILPMCVIRRLDAVLEPTKKAVLETKERLDKARSPSSRPQSVMPPAIVLQYFQIHFARSQIARQPAAASAGFFGLSGRILVQRSGHPRQFRVSRPLATLSKADAFGTLIGKFLDPEIDLSPLALTITPWARCSRNSSANSTRKTTRKPVNTGRRATLSGSWPTSFSCLSPARFNPALTCSTTALAARAAC